MLCTTPFLFQEQVLMYFDMYLMSTFAFFILQGELDCVGTQYHLLTNMPLRETFIPVNMVNTCTCATASLKFYGFLVFFLIN